MEDWEGWSSKHPREGDPCVQMRDMRSEAETRGV